MILESSLLFFLSTIDEVPTDKSHWFESALDQEVV
jgi:hypothetical protein